MKSRYTHLQSDERETLAALYQQDWSPRAIARLLKHSASTTLILLPQNPAP
ncbi:MAG: helix-turn-helix domain-containing protein [Acidovorax sp.]|nr:helix-turn-helix domain-containing protein [Acidovorax sp.]